jgi:tetratricopeptide (TPR) repeat protein
VLRARLALDDDDYQAAINAIDKYLDIEENSKEAWFIKGLALHKLGRVKDAIPAYNEVLRIEPNDIDTQLNLAEAHIIAGSYPDGISLAKDAEKRAKAASGKSNAIFLVVVALLLQDELDEADIVVNRLVQRLRKLKRRPRSGWDYSEINPTMQKLKGPKKELAFSIKALLSKEIDLDEFVKKRPKFRTQK